MALSKTRASASDTPAVVVTLGLILCLSVFSMDVNLPVFSLIAADLGAEPAEAQLIVSWFLLGYAGSQIPVGLMADRYGRLPILYLGLLLFLFASLFSALVSEFEPLLLGRFVQGMGAAAGAVIGRAMVRDISEGRRLSQLMAMLVSFLSVVSLVAPLIGSFLILYWSWRSTFWTTAGLSLLVLILIRRYLGETHRPEASRHSTLQQLKASLRVFFCSWPCLWGTLLVAIPFSGYMVLISSSSTLLIDIYGIKPAWVGLIFGISILSYLTGTLLTRIMVNRWGVWRMLKFSAVVFIFSSLCLVALSGYDTVPLPLLWAAFAVYLFGVGIIFPTGTAVVMQGVAGTAGFGASLLGTVQMSVAAFSTWLASMLYSHSTLSVTLQLTATGTITFIILLLGLNPVRRRAEATET